MFLHWGFNFSDHAGSYIQRHFDDAQYIINYFCDLLPQSISQLYSYSKNLHGRLTGFVLLVFLDMAKILFLLESSSCQGNLWWRFEKSIKPAKYLFLWLTQSVEVILTWATTSLFPFLVNLLLALIWVCPGSLAVSVSVRDTLLHKIIIWKVLFSEFLCIYVSVLCEYIQVLLKKNIYFQESSEKICFHYLL